MGASCAASNAGKQAAPALATATAAKAAPPPARAHAPSPCRNQSRLRRQATLRIGRADDPLERAADAMADRALAGSTASTTGITASPIAMLRRVCAECADEDALRRAPDVMAAQREPIAPDIVHDVLAQHGEPLMPALRQRMESGLGHDFGNVRVHRGDLAARASSAVGARAFTVGNQIAFAANAYAPGTPHGDRLIAHELAHVVQAGAAPGVVRRQTNPEGCPPSAPDNLNRQRGVVINPPLVLDGVSYTYAIYETFAAGDSDASYSRRSVERWVTWRFGVIDATARAQIISRMLAASSVQAMSVASARVGCNYAIAISTELLATVRRLAGEGRTSPAAEPPATGTADTGAATGPAPDTPPGGTATGAPPQPENPAAPPGPPSTAERQLDQPSASVTSDWRVFEGNEALARRYLLQMQHFAGMQVTERARALAAGGFDLTELRELIGSNRALHGYTDRYSQAYREFVAAGGSGVDAFSPLVELIFEQLNWGNPSAARNVLEIGRGGPSWVPGEDAILGIRHRMSHLLLYDSNGFPLRSVTGQMFRDEGYVAARPSDFGINIGSIEDPVLRGMLNMLRQQVGDPTRMVGVAAQVYFRNNERVKDRVIAGLPSETIRHFEDALPVFVLFLGAQGLSMLLMRSGHPVLMAIGAALRGLIAAAGYLLEIDFAAGAIDRLFQAARPLSRVREESDGTLTALSETYLDEAAVHLRSIVADIVVMAAMLGFARLLGAIRGRRGEPPRIECTTCTITPRPGEGTGGGARPVAEIIAEARRATPEEGIASLEALREPRAGRAAELRTRLERSADRAARLREQRYGASEARRAELLEQIRAEERRQAGLRAELDPLNREMSEIDRGIERIRNPNPLTTPPCFLAGTQVATPRGPRPIETLAVGDLVFAFDTHHDRLTTRAITAVHRGRAVQTCRLTVRGTAIDATLRHRFLVGEAWVDAVDLAPGDELLAIDGADARVDATELVDHAEDVTTYNLTVEVDATYFVGPGVLVHNDAASYSFGPYVVYEGVNPAFPELIYIGQTNDIRARGSQHQAEARAALREPGLSPAERRFWEFKANMELRPRVTGLDERMADFFEHVNFRDEVARRGRGDVMNRMEIATPERARALEAAIRADPRVRAAGYC